MKRDLIVRIARPTDNLAAITEMYATGLGLSVLGRFTDHAGFDGSILGNPQLPYHFEFTTQRGHVVGNAPSKDHLLVWYVPDRDEWAEACMQMVAAGFREVRSYNPYWHEDGKTFEDLDGYRVVLQNTPWEQK